MEFKSRNLFNYKQICFFDFNFKYQYKYNFQITPWIRFNIGLFQISGGLQYKYKKQQHKFNILLKLTLQNILSDLIIDEKSNSNEIYQNKNKYQDKNNKKENKIKENFAKKLHKKYDIKYYTPKKQNKKKITIIKKKSDNSNNTITVKKLKDLPIRL